MKAISQSRRAGRQAGSTTMEIALMVPALILILFGITDLCRWAFLAIEVNSAARAGAQYGEQNRATALDSSGIQTAAQNDVPDISSLTVSSSAVCWCSNAAGTSVSCNLSSCTGTNVLIPLLQVNTSTTYTPWILYGVFTSSFTISASVTVPQGQ